MYSVPKNRFNTIPENWLQTYTEKNINYRIFTPKDYYYWDYEILSLFKKYGANFFSRIDIWDVDWGKINHSNEILGANFTNPQTHFDKLLIKYLKMTQPYMNNIFFKIIDRIPRIFF